MEGLLATVLDLFDSWDKCFPQWRTASRAKALAMSLFLTLGRKTFTRIISAAGHDQSDWSADYRLFSRCVWSPRSLFRSIMKRALPLMADQKIIAVAYDDTLVRKTGGSS